MELCLLYLLYLITDTATTEIYTLSLHDALPISPRPTPTQPPSSASPQATCTRTRPSSCWAPVGSRAPRRDRKSTRLNSSHVEISYAVFCLKKKITTLHNIRMHTPHPASMILSLM